MSKLKLHKLSIFALPLIIAACGGDNGYGNNTRPIIDDNTPTMTEVSFEVEVVNLTANQPLAPVAILLHDEAFRGWQIGQPASPGLEILAESGNPADFISEAQSSTYNDTAGSNPLLPGERTSFQISAMLETDSQEENNLALTLASMPVNTNDAFSGTTGWSIGQLSKGQSEQRILPIYDAGTEFNSESADSVPGPAAGGSGYDEQRDDLANQVTRHPGIVSADDGYAASALNSSHKFDQGAMLVTITRL